MTSDPLPSDLVNVALVREQRTRVRDLRGFRKSHQLPTEVNDHTNSFVARIAADDISHDLESRFGDFRRLMNFRRVDLLVTEPEGGLGMITTPLFDYSVRAGLNPDDSTEVLWRRQLSEFRKPGHLFSSELSAVFGTTFDTVELVPPVAIDLTHVIDQIEQQSSETIGLEYDRHASWCRITLRGVPGELRLTSDRISLVLAQPLPPSQLLNAFLQVRSKLSGIECFGGTD
jgi:hypothetical protein